MSVYRRISDPVQSNVECTLMTQNGPSRKDPVASGRQAEIIKGLKADPK